VAFWLGLIWAKVEPRTGARVAVVILLTAALSVAIAIVPNAITLPDEGSALLMGIGLQAVTVLLTMLLIKKFFHATWRQAAKAWLAQFLFALGYLPLAIFVIKPFVFDAFTTPTNSMAPTLLGDHWQGKCMTCGMPAYCSAREGGGWISDQPQMICGNGFH